MYPQRAFFILDTKDLNFLADFAFYLFRLLWTPGITTSVQGSRKWSLRLLAPEFICFYFNLLPSEAYLIHLADTVNLCLCLSLFLSPSASNRVFILWLPADVPKKKNHPAVCKGNKIVADIEMSKEPSLFPNNSKSDRRRAPYPQSTMISLIRGEIKLSTFICSVLELSRV